MANIPYTIINDLYRILIDLGAIGPAGETIHAELGAGMFVDENNAAYGVKHVGNKPRVSSMPYTYDIAEGNVSGHEAVRMLGYNGALQNGVYEDLSPLSATAITLPTTAAQVYVDSSSGNDDGSPVLYSSTATGGTATTLVDTAQTFVSDGTIAAGDAILLDLSPDGAIGIITAVTNETTLTVAGGFQADTVPASGDAYRIVDKSLATGALAVEVHGLDASYDEQSEFVVLNGTTAVQTVGSYIRINSFHVVFTGSGGAPAGNLFVQDDAAGANKYSQIAIGDITSLQALYTVPADKTAYIISWTPSATGTKPVLLELAATVAVTHRTILPLFVEQDVVIVESGAIAKHFDLPLLCPAKSDIKVRGYGIGGVAEAAVSVEFWIE